MSDRVTRPHDWTYGWSTNGMGRITCRRCHTTRLYRPIGHSTTYPTEGECFGKEGLEIILEAMLASLRVGAPRESEEGQRNE